MSRFKLLLVLAVVPILSILAYLIRGKYLPNPLKEVSPNTEILSNIVGSINTFLDPTGEPPHGDEEEERSLEEEFADSGYPAELFSFDVTQKQAVFGVVSSDATRKTMILRYIFPFDLRGRIIEAAITCPLSDSKIIISDPGQQTTEVVSADQYLYEIADAGTDSLQGICGDTDCTSIVASCELVKTRGSITDDQPQD